jgi:hypothetical protein
LIVYEMDIFSGEREVVLPRYLQKPCVGNQLGELAASFTIRSSVRWTTSVGA